MKSNVKAILATVLIVAVWAIAPMSAQADDYSGFTGGWSGTWENGDKAKLTIESVTDDGNASGEMMHYDTDGSIRIYPFAPEKKIKAKVEDGKMKFRVGKMRFEFKPRKKGGMAFKFRWKSGGEAYTLNMKPETAQ